jgi:hypothetical protein
MAEASGLIVGGAGKTGGRVKRHLDARGLPTRTGPEAIAGNLPESDRSPGDLGYGLGERQRRGPVTS